MSQAEEKVVPVKSPVKPAVTAVAVLGFIALAVYLFFFKLLGIFLLLVFVILAIFIGFTFFDVAMRPETTP